MKLLSCEEPGLDDERFNTEFCNLIRFKHPNIVRFLGYCYDTRTELVEFHGRVIAAERIYRALCFEYLHNGSLDRYLCGMTILRLMYVLSMCSTHFRSYICIRLPRYTLLIFADESSGLDWNTRYSIIRAICEGLKYLHEGERPTYHLDLKPGNILLDMNMVPKLADFGLSRIFRENFTTRVTPNHYGTR